MREPDPTQNIRAVLLLAGALLGAAGMITENSLLVYLAIGVLAIGIMIAAVRRIQLRKKGS